MSDTTVVPLEDLARQNAHTTGQPLCPACKAGYLHPYKVEIALPNAGIGGWHGADTLTGWVAVCVGNADYLRYSAAEREKYGEPPLAPEDDAQPVEPCGFSLPMTPQSYNRR